ncbi:MAG: metal ABC transporter permease [Candidatus Aminicenantes bacterium]
MFEILSYGFIQRAFLAGGFIAVSCALLGVFLILRRDAMIGHGLAHVIFAGVALGLLLEIMPLLSALAVGILTALAVLKIKQTAGLYGDTAIAIFSSTGFALGVLLVTLSRRFNVDLFSYLFGEVLAIENSEVWISLAITLTVIGGLLWNYPRLMYITFDPESAKVSGIRVERLEMMLTVMTAVTIVLGIKIVGILLIPALLVIPAAGGLQLASHFKGVLIASAVIGFISAAAGLLLSILLDWPPSATIVLLAFLIFLILFAFKKKSNR